MAAKSNQDKQASLAREAYEEDKASRENDSRLQDMKAHAEAMAEERRRERQETESLSTEDIELKRNLEEVIKRRPTDSSDPRFADIRKKYANARRMTPGIGGTRDRIDPQIDKFCPTDTTHRWDSDEAAKLFHVGPGCHVINVHDPAVYGDIRNSLDRILYTIPDAKVVTRKSDGKPYKVDDVMFVSIPDVYREAYESVENEDADAWEQSIAEASQHGSITESDPDIQAKQRAIAAAARARSAAMHVNSKNNSPTAGMTIIDFHMTISDDDLVAMESRARSGNRHMSMEEMQEASKAGDKRSKTFGGLTGKMDQWERSGDKAKAGAGATA